MKYTVIVSTPEIHARKMGIAAQNILKFPLHDFEFKPGTLIHLTEATNFQVGEIITHSALRQLSYSRVDNGLEERYLVVKPVVAKVTAVNAMDVEVFVYETLTFEHTDRVVDHDKRMMTIDSLYPGYITIKDDGSLSHVVKGDYMIIRSIGGSIQYDKKLDPSEIRKLNELADITSETNVDVSDMVDKVIPMAVESIPAVQITDPLPSEKDFTPEQMMRDCFPGYNQSKERSLGKAD